MTVGLIPPVPSGLAKSDGTGTLMCSTALPLAGCASEKDTFGASVDSAGLRAAISGGACGCSLTRSWDTSVNAYVDSRPSPSAVLIAFVDTSETPWPSDAASERACSSDSGSIVAALRPLIAASCRICASAAVSTIVRCSIVPLPSPLTTSTVVDWKHPLETTPQKRRAAAKTPCRYLMTHNDATDSAAAR